MKQSFSEWLKSQLDLRRMTQQEFAEKGGITPSQVSHVINGLRGAGEDFYRATATALRMPVVEVYKAAGRLPENDNRQLSLEAQRILVIMESLDEGKRKQLLEFAEFLRTRAPE